MVSTYIAAAAPGSRLTILSRDVVKVAGGDTNNNR